MVIIWTEQSVCVYDLLIVPVPWLSIVPAHSFVIVYEYHISGFASVIFVKRIGSLSLLSGIWQLRLYLLFMSTPPPFRLSSERRLFSFLDQIGNSILFRETVQFNKLADSRSRKRFCAHRAIQDRLFRNVIVTGSCGDL